MNLLFIILGVVGPTEVILILAIVLLLFCGKKIPELMKGLGTGIKEFKKASQGDYDDEKANDTKRPVQDNNQVVDKN